MKLSQTNAGLLDMLLLFLQLPPYSCCTIVFKYSRRFHGEFIHTQLAIITLQSGLSIFLSTHSHTTHVLSLNLIREWRSPQSNVDSERQIFEKLFHGRLILFTLKSFCQKSKERNSSKKYFCSYFGLMPELGY